MGRSPKRMVPQTTVSIRNSSSLEVNSYRGHEFVIRRQEWKVELSQQDYEPQNDEAIMVVGATNDIVVVDEALELSRYDAAWALRRAVRSSMASPKASLEDVVLETTRVLESWRAAWLAESNLRVAMGEDLVALGGTFPPPPVEPPGGWPSRESDLPARLVVDATSHCAGHGVPRDPGWYDGDEVARRSLDEAKVRELLAEWDDHAADTCAEQLSDEETARAYELAAKHDGHNWCTRWARVGECENNPNYMLVRCARSCALWQAYGRATIPIDDDLLEAARQREAFVECVGKALDAPAAAYRGALSAEQNAKADFSEELRNRTCAVTAPGQGSIGPHLPSGDADELFVDADGREISIVPLFRSSPALPAANISLLQRFATEQECQRVIDAARPRLTPATVNAEDNPAARSLSRRAHAANVEPDPNNPNDLVSKLWHRAFDAANALTGYGLDPHGQEPFSVIFYNGSRAAHDDGLPDEYRPHCDGSCDGSPHLHGGRVATLLLYCAVPDKGGATSFTNARTVATPNPTDAVFFSYLNKDTNEMDTGLTQHSGCPVLRGDKWVMTLWMRKGISAADSWTKYDPTGARHDGSKK